MFNKYYKFNLSNTYARIILLLIICFITNFAMALKGDDKQPLQIDADHATLDQKQMVSVFEGNVVITKGSLVVHADKGIASQDVKGERVLTFEGRPVTFVQLADDGQQIQGQGNHFNYNTKSHLAVLSGRARVRKGKSEVIGDILTYNSDTQVYSASSNIGNGVTKKSGGRITVILDQQPNGGTTLVTTNSNSVHTKKASSNGTE